MIQLQNDFHFLEFTENGELNVLQNRKTGRIIARRHRLCRLILGNAENREFEAHPSGNPEASESPDGVAIRFSRVTTDDGREFPIGVTLEIRPENELIRWGCRLENRTGDMVVRETHYPIFALESPEPPMAVNRSFLTAERIVNLPEFIKKDFTSYMAPDQKYIRTTEFYPGNYAAVNFLELDWDSEIFYMGCHDEHFNLTGHSFELENGGVHLFFARYPFLSAGNSAHDRCIVAAAVRGDWADGAAIYRAWADSSWMPEPLPRPPEHVIKSHGWQRLIMNHQYGEWLLPYDRLEQAYDEGRKAGIDSLLLFGWWSAGMDSGYPHYEIDPAQGGFEAFRKNIRTVQAKGGKIILYFNGQLIDVESEYYRSGEGKRVAVKRENGAEFMDSYNFSNTGTFLRNFGNKTFAVACHACPEWVEILKRHIDLAVKLGVDSIFFDQFGLMCYPCCDPSHGHRTPFTNQMEVRRRVLGELYGYAKAKAPQMGFGYECPLDLMLGKADFVHLTGCPFFESDPGARKRGEKPQMTWDRPLFRAAFPELRVSNRCIRDDSDPVFAVNQSMLRGCTSDVEVYRCRSSIGAAPLYREYLGLANKLRERHLYFFLDGKYSETKFHSLSDPVVQTSEFLLGNRLAVLLTQSSSDSLETAVGTPGFVLDRVDSIRGDVTFFQGKCTLPRDAFALLLYHKISQEKK